VSEETEQPEIVDREPGEVVLRAEPVRDAPPPAPVESLDYHIPRPEPRQRPHWLDEVTWPRLLLAIFALLILFPQLIPKFIARSDRNNGRLGAAKVDLANFESALNAFEIDVGRYPTQGESLRALVARTGREWHGPYLKSIPTDPWGSPYVYVFPGIHNEDSFDLSSNGPDKRPGTGDDLTNW
jgi:general secretion pathway protein G